MKKVDRSPSEGHTKTLAFIASLKNGVAVTIAYDIQPAPFSPPDTHWVTLLPANNNAHRLDEVMGRQLAKGMNAPWISPLCAFNLAAKKFGGSVTYTDASGAVRPAQNGRLTPEGATRVTLTFS